MGEVDILFEANMNKKMRMGSSNLRGGRTGEQAGE